MQDNYIHHQDHSIVHNVQRACVMRSITCLCIHGYVRIHSVMQWHVMHVRSDVTQCVALRKRTHTHCIFLHLVASSCIVRDHLLCLRHLTISDTKYLSSNSSTQSTTLPTSFYTRQHTLSMSLHHVTSCVHVLHYTQHNAMHRSIPYTWYTIHMHTHNA